MEDTAEYRYVTDFELDPQPRTKSLSQVLNGHSLTINSVPAKPQIMWRTSPTLVNQALPLETSTQEEGDTIHFSVKYVENYFPWSIFKFLVASIEMMTKLRQEQQDADAMESQQVRNTTSKYCPLLV